MKISLLVCLLVACLGQIQSTSKLVCYYEGWFAYPSHGAGAMQVKDFDNTACTHRVYGYNGVTAAADVLITDPWLETGTSYHQLYDWGHNKGTDLSLMGIGGYTASKDLHYATENPTLFTTNVVAFLKKYALDGLVIEWSANNWNYEYMESYVTLLKHLKEAFAANKFVLGTVVAANMPGYDIKSVAEQVDLVIVQAYDYHGSWNTEVGHASALEDQKMTITQWISSGAPAEKLIVTVPAYGHTWTLTDPTKTDPGSPASGPGTKRPFTDTPGKIGYNEFALLLKDDPTGWHRFDDGAVGAAYYVKGNQWVSIEDVKTAEAKGQWVKTAGLGGIAEMAVNNDDFNAIASPTKFPLLKAFAKGLQ